MHGTLPEIPVAAVNRLTPDPVPIESYGALIRILRQRVAELNTTFSTIDQVAGLASNYLAKLIAPQPMKAMSAFTLLLIVHALGCRLQLVPDDVALAKLRQRSDWQTWRRPGERYRANRHKPRRGRRRSRAAV